MESRLVVKLMERPRYMREMLDKMLVKIEAYPKKFQVHHCRGRGPAGKGLNFGGI